MFEWLNKQGVQSSAGFAVQSVDRFAIEYREGSLVVTVGVERGSFGGGPSLSVAPNAVARWDGASFTNSAEKQQQMRANFKAAMAFQGITVEED
jgi:hypothetical protein